jgi:glycerophosphoryl diester phosphodiesterase
MSFFNLSFQPPLIAHRGASSVAPENTLIAFTKAKELGFKWVEFDVMLTADDQVVVIHDEFLDRTTNGNGRVEDINYNDLITLDAGSWFAPCFRDERVPSLIQVITLLNTLNLSANVEIKAQLGKEEQTVKCVLSILNAYWNDATSHYLLSSFSLTVLNTIRVFDHRSPMGFLMDEWQDDWRNNCDNLRCSSVNVNQAILTQENVTLIKSTQRLLLAYTVNQQDRALELFSWGVDAVFTDDIRKLSKERK